VPAMRSLGTGGMRGDVARKRKIHHMLHELDRRTLISRLDLELLSKFYQAGVQVAKALAVTPQRSGTVTRPFSSRGRSATDVKLRGHLIVVHGAESQSQLCRQQRVTSQPCGTKGYCRPASNPPGATRGTLQLRQLLFCDIQTPASDSVRPGTV
jgi:hypothetical protein